jgi:hypothetical protein
MSPALREGARAFFNEIGTPHDAPARRMLERSSFGFDLENPLRVDNCEICGAVCWRDCVCNPNTPRSAPTPEAVERARALRLMRAELEPELYGGCDCSEQDGR